MNRILSRISLMLILAASIGMAQSPQRAAALRKATLHQKIVIARDIAALGDPTAVPNTNDSGATAFVVGPGIYTGSTDWTSTTDDGDASCGGSRDVWFRFTPAASGSWVLTNLGTALDGVLSVHTAIPGSSANQLACNDSYSNDRVTLSMTAGVPYYIRLAGYQGMVGAYQLTIEENPNLNNSQIEVAVDDNGNFTMGRMPNPSDSANWLLFGHPNPWSGATTLRVDGVNYWNFAQGNLGTQVSGPTRVGNLITTVWRAGGIELQQKLELVRGVSSPAEDTLLIAYTLTNIDTVAHAAGLRMLFDTYLGSNDGAPFRIPGLGDVTFERELTGASIPQYWTAFDDLLNPNKTAQGSLVGPNGAFPDRVVWGDWSTMSSFSWDYTIDPNRVLTDDSAIYLYYNPRMLGPGQSITHGTYYGLSVFNIDTAEPLAVGLNCVDRLQVYNNAYVPNPFLVTAYIENSLAAISGDLTGTFAELQLPPQMELSGGALRQDIGTLARGANVQLNWYVKMRPNLTPDGELPGADDTFTLRLRVGTTNQGEKTLTRTITTPEVYNAVRNWSLYP